MRLFLKSCCSIWHEENLQPQVLVVVLPLTSGILTLEETINRTIPRTCSNQCFIFFFHNFYLVSIFFILLSYSDRVGNRNSGKNNFFLCHLGPKRSNSYGMSRSEYRHSWNFAFLLQQFFLLYVLIILAYYMTFSEKIINLWYISLFCMQYHILKKR